MPQNPVIINSGTQIGHYENSFPNSEGGVLTILAELQNEKKILCEISFACMCTGNSSCLSSVQTQDQNICAIEGRGDANNPWRVTFVNE